MDLHSRGMRWFTQLRKAWGYSRGTRGFTQSRNTWIYTVEERQGKSRNARVYTVAERGGLHISGKRGFTP